jgi:N-acetylmuramoyl-L-alanine amidase
VSGTSTYYKWPFCRDLSDAIHARLLEGTKLGDFGNVGNFNYYPLRANTWMPSMLVEQAFMSNPEDEAKMLDPVFRKKMMRAVVLGTKDWLKRMRAEAGDL